MNFVDVFRWFFGVDTVTVGSQIIVWRQTGGDNGARICCWIDSFPERIIWTSLRNSGEKLIHAFWTFFLMIWSSISSQFRMESVNTVSISCLSNFMCDSGAYELFLILYLRSSWKGFKPLGYHNTTQCQWKIYCENNDVITGTIWW